MSRIQGQFSLVILVVVRISVGLQSSKGLTDAKGSLPRLLRFQDYWQEASFVGDLTDSDIASQNDSQ